MALKVFQFAGVSLLGLIATMAPYAARAQVAPVAPNDATAVSADNETTLGDIVVTGTKKARGEQLQDVPIAATAFGQKEIQKTFATSIMDIGQSAPSVRLTPVGTIPGVANFSIRGMGLYSSIPSDEPTVGVFVDGVYLATTFGSLVDTFDLDSIEMLRGPQGTLFGRNVTGGAVNITTVRPTGKFGLDLVGNLGSGGRRELGGAIQGALTETLAGRLSVSYKHLTGFYDNAARPGTHVDEDDSITVRPTLRWTPSDTTTVTFLGEYAHSDGGGARVKLLRNPATGLQRPVAQGGAGYVPPADATTLDQNFDAFTNQERYGGALEIRSELGAGELVSITGYRHVTFDAALDQDATSIDFQRNYTKFRQSQISQELRYAISTDQFDVTVGVYGFQQKYWLSSLIYIVPSPLGSLGSQGSIRDSSLAAFANGEWHFANGLSVTGGLRLTHNSKKADLGYGRAGVGGSCDFSSLPTFTCATKFAGEKSWTDLSPKLGVNWKISPDTLLFADVTRGYRSGGYNVRNYVPAASPGPYNPEKVTAYQAGLKQDFWEGRARANITAYVNNYDNLQQTVLNTDGTSTILNAASAQIKGIEFEAAVRPVSALRLNASVGYIDARYKSFTGLDLTGDGVPDPTLAKRLKLLRAPEWTWSVGGAADLGEVANGTVSLGGVLSYTGSQPINTANLAFIPKYKLLDANLTWTSADDRVTLSAYGKNLLDDNYATTGFVVGAVGTGLYYAQPLSYGVEARLKF